MMLGVATSAGWSTIMGFGGGIGVSVGKSTVGQPRVTDCNGGDCK